MITNFLIGSFIAFFLIVFQPFQIDLWITEHKTLKLIGFGCISFFVPTLISFLIGLTVPKKILEDSWKIWHEILSIVAVVCGIALGNLIFGNYVHIMNFSLNGYFNALMVVLAIGIFPISFYVLSNQNRMLKRNLENAKLMNSGIEILQREGQTDQPTKMHTNELVLVSENEKDRLILQPSQLLYIESADNYSNVVFTENGSKKKILMRSSLKRIESQLNSGFIMRCHRAFIINLKNVKSIEGNAAGYKAYFPESDIIIPVSRNYCNAVLERLRSVN
jgi:hypothetical protein